MTYWSESNSSRQLPASTEYVWVFRELQVKQSARKCLCYMFIWLKVYLKIANVSKGQNISLVKFEYDNVQGDSIKIQLVCYVFTVNDSPHPQASVTLGF